MKKTLSLLSICILLNAQDTQELLKQAKEYEKANDYKNAMLIYKKLANVETIEFPKEEEVKIVKEKKIVEKKEVTPLKNGLNSFDDKETKSTIEQMLESSFDIYAYQENYFFPISYDTKSKEDRKRNEAKFQLSIKKPIIHDFFGFDETFYFGYTQTSWWQIYDDSSPFRETNYKPEVFVTVPYGKKDETALKGFKAGFLHESNGQSEEKSRSWNRIYLETYFQYKHLFVVPKVWYRLKEDKDSDDNHDIDDYLGYGDLTLMYPYKDHTFKLLLRNNLKSSDNRSYGQLDWTFPFFGSKNTFGHIQISSGYGESLIDYNEDITRINFGISLSR
ncbi:phospholipase [Arcobacter sp. F155]|uniref:phospholipase A n=1 Tax=Arcobacter sp. F155 TaxID=2044512 RepID=UPI00100B2A29|nr:phospholipase A [Arcobacter sp. F155]RXJ78568.1 phospholipase [Arcobacter sp. F155]